MSGILNSAAIILLVFVMYLVVCGLVLISEKLFTDDQVGHKMTFLIGCCVALMLLALGAA